MLTNRRQHLLQPGDHVSVCGSFKFDVGDFEM